MLSNHVSAKLPKNTLLIVDAGQSILSKKTLNSVYYRRKMEIQAPERLKEETLTQKQRDYLAQYLQSNQAALADEIVSELRTAGISAISSQDLNHLSAKKRTAPKLYLRADFHTLQQGDQALKTWVGFGAGKTRMTLEVTLGNETFTKPHQYLSFSLKSDSGWAPGIMTGTNPLSKEIDTSQAQQAAQKIAPEIIKYYKSNNWL